MARPPIFHKVNEAMGGKLLDRIAEMRKPPKRSWDDIAHLVSVESGHKVSRGAVRNWHGGDTPQEPAA